MARLILLNTSLRSPRTSCGHECVLRVQLRFRILLETVSQLMQDSTCPRNTTRQTPDSLVQFLNLVLECAQLKSKPGAEFKHLDDACCNTDRLDAGHGWYGLVADAQRYNKYTVSGSVFRPEMNRIHQGHLRTLIQLPNSGWKYESLVSIHD